MSNSSDYRLSPGCRDRLIVASSLACIVALVVSILGLARAMFDVTLPLGRSGVDEICLQVGDEGADRQSSTWDRTVSGLSSRSPRQATGSDTSLTPVLPTATLRPTMTIVPPTAPPAPTHTPILPTPIPPTPTAVSSAVLTTTAPITAQAAVSATADHLLQAPILLNPVPESQLHSGVHFQWQWDGQPLPEGLAFDLLIWSEAEEQEHLGQGAFGVIDTEKTLECDVDLDYVHTIVEHGEGTYYWTIIVVQEEPYERVGVWGEKRSFTYVFPGSPAEPTAEGP